MQCPSILLELTPLGLPPLGRMAQAGVLSATVHPGTAVLPFSEQLVTTSISVKLTVGDVCVASDLKMPHSL